MSILTKLKRFISYRFRRIIRPAIVDVCGVKLLVKHNQISNNIRDLIYRNKYEVDELEILRNKLSSEDIVLELGAGVGYISTWVEKKIGVRGRVFTIEANPLLTPLIQETYRLNNVSPHLFSGCLGESAGVSKFFPEDDLYSSSLVRRTDHSKPVMIEQIDAGEAMARIKPTLLIVDIEGGEVDLFRYLELDGVNKICIELHPHIIGNKSCSVIIANLIEQGFYVDFESTRNSCYYLERGE